MDCDHQLAAMLQIEADHETLNALVIFINKTQAGIIRT